jgi:hypothetical protein
MNGNQNDSDHNIAIGHQALNGLTTGDGNISIGGGSGYAVTDVDNLVLIGKDAGGAINNSGADGTVAIGASALVALTSGVGNVAIGYQALDAEDDGDYNTAVGYQALTAQTGTSGTVNNTAVGYQAGDSITSGTKNTILGASSDANSGNAINQTCVGANVTGVADYSVTLGDADVTAVYMAQDKGATVYCGGIQVEKNASGYPQIVGNGMHSLADDATLTISVQDNTLILISENTHGRSAVFHGGYSDGTVKMSDPANIYDNADTDAKVCIYKSNNTKDVILKNRLGATRSFRILVLSC